MAAPSPVGGKKVCLLLKVFLLSISLPDAILSQPQSCQHRASVPPIASCAPAASYWSAIRRTAPKLPLKPPLLRRHLRRNNTTPNLPASRFYLCAALPHLSLRAHAHVTRLGATQRRPCAATPPPCAATPPPLSPPLAPSIHCPCAAHTVASSPLPPPLPYLSTPAPHNHAMRALAQQRALPMCRIHMPLRCALHVKTQDPQLRCPHTPYLPRCMLFLACHSTAPPSACQCLIRPRATPKRRHSASHTPPLRRTAPPLPPSTRSTHSQSIRP